MKTFMIIALVLSSTLQFTQSYRCAEVEVDEVRPEFGTVSFVDTDGELWVIESDDVSDYVSGDKYALVYDTVGTDDIYDDEIIAVAKWR